MLFFSDTNNLLISHVSANFKMSLFVSEPCAKKIERDFIREPPLQKKAMPEYWVITTTQRGMENNIIHIL